MRPRPLVAIVIAVCLTLISAVVPSSAATGPYLVRDLRGAAGGDPLNLTAAGSRLFFTAKGDAGRELWVSDGTRDGTVQVKDIRPGNLGSEPYGLSAVGNTLYFAATDGIHGHELWKSDGTSAGTMMVADLDPGPESSMPSAVTDVSGTLFFFTQQPRVDLWTTKGSAVGTKFVETLSPGNPTWPQPRNKFVFNGRFWFTASLGPDGNELRWVSNGTARGTKIFRGREDLKTLDRVTKAGSRYFFAGTDLSHGTEVWLSPDNTLAHARFVADTAPGTNQQCGCPLSGQPREFTSSNSGQIFFTAGYTELQTPDGTADVELWRSDGTLLGTRRVKDLFPGSFGSYPRSLTPFRSGIAFSTETAGALWTSDGTSKGTKQIPISAQNPLRLTNVNGTLVFSSIAGDGVDQELWRSDGTAAGTFLVSNINPSGTSSPRKFTVVGQGVFFTANDGTHGRELWRFVP